MTTPRGGPDDDEHRFRALYETTYGDLLRFVQRRVPASHAEDVAAETMLVAWRRLDDLPAEAGSARAWVFGIARHLLLNAHRGERRRGSLEVRLAEAASTGPTGDDAALVAHRIDLARAWARLTPQHQESLSLAVWDGLTAAEAAQVLGISPVAFRLRLSRARRALRALTAHLPEPAAAPTGVATGATRRSPR